MTMPSGTSAPAPMMQFLPTTQWFSKVAKIAVDHKVPYFMTWSNFEKLTNNFFAPYMVSKNRGHEMINEFVDFYNEPETLFADGVNWQSLKK